jgi:hypothetical protein
MSETKKGNPNWVKGGASPNPGGRKAIPPDVKEAFSALTPRAIARLSRLLDSDDEKVALAACREVFDRDLGKSVQRVETDAKQLDDNELKRAVIEIADQWKQEDGAMQ